MPRNWYGNAQSARTAPRTHNGQRTLSAVGGVSIRPGMIMRGTAHAIYGSTDHAQADHRNSVLCRALAITDAAKLHEARHYDGPAYGPNIYRYAPSNGPITEMPVVTPEVTVPTADEVAYLVKRAVARNMTLVEYCALIGVPVPS